MTDESSKTLAVRERMVFAESSDGFSLAGVLFEPGKRPAPAPATLVVWLHGIHLQFCEPEYVAIGRAVARQGLAFLSANTRGHDFGCWLRNGAELKLAGSGWELLHECIADLEGWLRFAAREGFADLVLAGHGFGGSKIVYHLSERHEPAVRGVILASCASIVRDTLLPELTEQAEAMVAAGRGMDLLPWGTRPGVMTSTVSAQVHVARARLRQDLYGDGQRPPALTKIRVPVLAWFGEREIAPGRDVNRFLETTAHNLTACPRVDIKVLPGASYLYTGAEARVAREIVRWTARVRP